MENKGIFDAPVKDKNGNLQFFSPSGEKVRVKYIWNEKRDGLVEHERIDIVKVMNERAKGMSIAEQIARLDRGDTSVIDPSKITAEDFSCDVSGMPESSIEIIQQKNDVKAAVMEMKASEAQASAENAELRVLQQELINKKAEYDKALKAFDDKKQQTVVVKKEGE